MSAPQSGRVAVIGDVGGHRVELERELRRLGADPATGRLPDDLTVVQVGDLIHRGPDSDGVVALVGGYLVTQPRQWVQLVGNHEAQYLRPPVFDWPERIGDDAIEALRGWWSDARIVVATAIDTGREAFLVTHAGLTAGFWRAALGAPHAARDAARALNSFIGTQEDALFAPGHMLSPGGRASTPNHEAGPVWAAAASELVPSWLVEQVSAPFSQVHGHSMIADWRGHRLRADDEVAARTQIDESAAHEIVDLPGGARIIGVDPGHGRRPHRPWRAFVLDDARVVT